MRKFYEGGALDCNIKLCNSRCCRNCAVLTGDEVLKLVEDVRKEYGFELDPKKYFRQAKGKYGVYFALKMIKGQCIFLNKEKRCRIYRCRPVLCELYPVIDVDAMDEHCPQVKNKKIPDEFLAILKKRYAAEIDEDIKKEQQLWFI
ncbi:MAG: YkgJ family cysteine cluster protein [Candidatus Methanoperedens sp.]|nr:YkgJ family cysteine cluster protein [Candidatus Methanoperedens sp.]